MFARKTTVPQDSKTIDSPLRLTEIKPGVWEIILNRPERRNAFSSTMLRLFAESLERIRTDAGARILVLRGMGTLFCGGLDLKEAFSDEKAPESEKYGYFGGAADFPADLSFRMPARVVEILHRLLTLPQTVFAVAQGGAFGGGAGLLAVSDYVLADSRFRLGFPELRRGLRPSLLHPFLRRKLSESAMKELLLTGEALDAETVKRFGLVQRIEPFERLDEAAGELLERFLAGEPKTAKMAKALLNETLIPPTDEIVAGLFDHWESWKSREAGEGVAAFLEKRPPNWEF